MQPGFRKLVRTLREQEESKVQTRYIADVNRVRKANVRREGERWLDLDNDVYYPDSMVFTGHKAAKAALEVS